MKNSDVYASASSKFIGRFGRSPSLAAYAPGRIEVIGNHTDYNEGFVLSAAINYGTYFLAAPVEKGTECRLAAVDLDDETSFDVTSLSASREHSWANYVKGVLAGLGKFGRLESGFDGLIMGNIPLGAGLSSSAALEMASGIALSALYEIEVELLELARIGQAAEHEYAGVKCGLLDQISSLFGRENELVMTDFRSLEVKNIPLGADVCFLMCNTHVKHALVDGEYNERRKKCEEAAEFFAGALDHPVTALRDVSRDEWETHSSKMDPLTAKRSAHPIGENERVLKSTKLLESGDLEAFGQLMLESHASSVSYFENSCEELDFIVSEARGIPGALGARLSGGGFGGSAVILTRRGDAEEVCKSLASAYEVRYVDACDISSIMPSKGASLIEQ